MKNLYINKLILGYCWLQSELITMRNILKTNRKDSRWFFPQFKLIVKLKNALKFDKNVSEYRL